MTSFDQEPQQPQPQQSLPDNSAPAKKSQKVSSNWPLGLAVVLIGGVLLARNLGVELFFLDFDNWWAFFILLLAIGPLQLAIRSYKREGFGAATLNALVSTVAIVFVALIFLIDLSWGTWWPMFIIIGGLYVITNKN